MYLCAQHPGWQRKGGFVSTMVSARTAKAGLRAVLAAPGDEGMLGEDRLRRYLPILFSNNFTQWFFKLVDFRGSNALLGRSRCQRKDEVPSGAGSRRRRS
eukprot:COSAG02_NODE_51124_length_316_cov_0.709677_1_plen_99_part_10